VSETPPPLNWSDAVPAGTPFRTKPPEASTAVLRPVPATDTFIGDAAAVTRIPTEAVEEAPDPMDPLMVAPAPGVFDDGPVGAVCPHAATNRHNETATA